MREREESESERLGETESERETDREREIDRQRGKEEAAMEGRESQSFGRGGCQVG